MDIATIIGILLGFGGIIGGNILEGGHIASLLQGPAAVIVFGGTIGATLVSFSLRDVLGAARAAVSVFRPAAADPGALIGGIVSMAQVARKDGMLALEKNLATVENPFMRKYLQQIIDGVEADALRSHMDTEIELVEEEKLTGSKVFEAAGGYAPTVGIIGAVLGLIHTMQSLNDPSRLGGGIAVAFVATVYGVGSANLLFLPVANKLKRRAAEEMIVYRVIAEGLLALQAGHNPKMIGEKLRIFVSDKRIEAEPAGERKAA